MGEIHDVRHALPRAFIPLRCFPPASGGIEGGGLTPLTFKPIQISLDIFGRRRTNPLKAGQGLLEMSAGLGQVSRAFGGVAQTP